MSTSYSLAKAQFSQTFNQNFVLLFVFSFSSSIGQFQFTFAILKYLSAILFVLGKSLIVLQYN
jgi:hypothetical protein